MRDRPGIFLVIILLAAVLGGCKPGAGGATLIRIHNASTYDYDELQVGQEVYGALPAGAYTEYRDFGTAYRYNYVLLRIGADEFVIQPIDYVGEEPLGEGTFTYEIDVVDYDSRNLSIEAVED
jgi:hypothetical protein